MFSCTVEVSLAGSEESGALFSMLTGFFEPFGPALSELSTGSGFLGRVVDSAAAPDLALLGGSGLVSADFRRVSDFGVLPFPDPLVSSFGVGGNKIDPSLTPFKNLQIAVKSPNPPSGISSALRRTTGPSPSCSSSTPNGRSVLKTLLKSPNIRGCIIGDAPESLAGTNRS